MSQLDESHEIDYKGLLEQLLHELRVITHVIKSGSEILSKSVTGNNIDKSNLLHHSELIFDNAYLLSLLLDIADFELNPEFFSSQAKHSRSLWGKFKKASMSIRRIAKNRHISLNMDGESVALLDSFPVIDILPYILLDNAVKYSPSYGSVDISFDEDVSVVSVSVSSMGPALREDEIDMIFERGFRADSAEDSQIVGFGQGLAMAKNICDIHEASISVKQGSVRTQYEGVTYAPITFNLVFRRQIA